MTTAKRKNAPLAQFPRFAAPVKPETASHPGIIAERHRMYAERARGRVVPTPSRICNATTSTTDPYMGTETRQACIRAGAMAAFSLPSRVGDRRTYLALHTTPQGTP